MSQQESGLVVWRSDAVDEARATVCGWQAIAKWLKETKGWNAYLESLDSSERIQAPQVFLEAASAQDWCKAEILKRCSLARFADLSEWPQPFTDLRDSIIYMLKQCSTLTAWELIAETLIEWGWKRAAILEASGAYSDWPHEWLADEQKVYFLLALNKMDYGEKSIPCYAATSAITSLETDQIKHLAHQWGTQLIQRPFYETIYTYTLAVHEWLCECDLSPFMKDNVNREKAVKLCLNKWSAAFDIYDIEI